MRSRAAIFNTMVLGFLSLTAVAGVAQQSAPAPASPLLAAVERDVAAGKPSAVDQFWKTVDAQKTPLVEKLPGDDKRVLATFLWRDDGETKDVVVEARPNGIDAPTDSRSHMRRLPGTNIWFLSHRLPADAEFLYQLLVNLPAGEDGLNAAALRQTARPDPLNPRSYPENFDPTQPWRAASIARMPATPENPWLVQQTGVPVGTLEQHTVKSDILKLGNPREVSVYLTPGAQLQNPNLLILFDGGVYKDRIPTPVILDNLYAAHKIGQTVAVFLDNGGPEARQTDLAFSDAFVKFLVDELVPWVEREYKFKATPSRTVLGGDSLGGLMAAYAALRRPDIFGKVISQSGAFQFPKSGEDNNEPEWLARQIVQAPKSEVFFCLDVGQMEDRPGSTTLLAANRHLRDVLKAKGYRIHYFEVYGDHDPIHWRRTLPEALVVTLGS